MKLSGRAHNVIVNVLLRKTTLPTGECLGVHDPRWLDSYIEKANAKLLKKALLAALDVGASSAYSSLLLVRNCGNVATREICTALGLWMPDKPHRCICRQCGRKM